MSSELTKAEVNERFYNAVGGQILFETEAQGYLHPYAVARLIAAQARQTHRKALKILELGANNSVFALSLVKLLTALTVGTEVELDQIDYFAVDYARSSLDAFFGSQEAGGDFHRATRGAAGTALVGSLTRLGVPQTNLFLVHSDAKKFVTGGSARIDFAVLNELLDDLPSRTFYADADGRKHELFVRASEDLGKWHVTVTAEETTEPGLDDMPPSTLTTRSPDSVAIVRGAAELLESGGMLLVHDYGFIERYAALEGYEPVPVDVADFVELEFPPGSESGFPRRFFRVFGNREANAVQITTDVGFAEIIEELEPLGTVITLPHGNALLRSRTPECDDLRKGDGIFLSEFGTLDPGDDFRALLVRLDEQQHELRESFQREWLGETASLYADLLFIKD